MSQNLSLPETKHENPHSPHKDWLDKFIEYKLRGSSIEIRNTLLVVVILITTATYQTSLSPPGGLWQDTGNSTLPQLADDGSPIIKHHYAGEAIMGTHRHQAPYAVFVITNSLGFYMSVYMIYMLTIDFPLMRELQISMIVLTVNHANCTFAIVPSEYTMLRITCVVIFVIFGTLILLLGFRFLGRRSKWFK
ncbi:unnamed protein product [Lactuca saligna]|uniref:PGG domain-containing protein n=1 Tax=Lactuca saligna TaxID=75948 RepID=A0AA35YD74_LACSI|nr:unnamed protein product [Lactuca saligna]